jgi:ABC-type Zn uptake system ZnuABC Zn-binding protein ZnuA
MRQTGLRFGWWTAGIALVACACGGEASDGATDTLEIVTSTTIIQDWVRQVGGEHVDVSTIVPRETDVHSYLLVPGDIRRVGGAGLVFIAGAGLESSFAEDIRANADTVVELSDGLPLKPFPEGLAHDHDDGDDDDGDDGEGSHGAALDPHIFLDIDLTIGAVERIRDELAAADPAHATDYESNAASYIAELRALDGEIASKLSALPESRRYIVTFHDAYGYFAARYGLQLLGFVVEGPEEQPAASDIARLVDEIHQHGVEHIYTEPQFNARVVEQLASDAGVEVRTLPSDALSDDYPDYVAFMRAIADGIAR